MAPELAAPTSLVVPPALPFGSQTGRRFSRAREPLVTRLKRLEVGALQVSEDARLQRRNIHEAAMVDLYAAVATGVCGGDSTFGMATVAGCNKVITADVVPTRALGIATDTKDNVVDEREADAETTRALPLASTADSANAAAAFEVHCQEVWEGARWMGPCMQQAAVALKRASAAKGAARQGGCVGACTLPSHAAVGAPRRPFSLSPSFPPSRPSSALMASTLPDKSVRFNGGFDLNGNREIVSPPLSPPQEVMSPGGLARKALAWAATDGAMVAPIDRETQPPGLLGVTSQPPSRPASAQSYRPRSLAMQPAHENAVALAGPASAEPALPSRSAPPSPVKSALRTRLQHEQLSVSAGTAGDIRCSSAFSTSRTPTVCSTPHSVADSLTASMNLSARVRMIERHARRNLRVANFCREDLDIEVHIVRQDCERAASRLGMNIADVGHKGGKHTLQDSRR
eukprot:TRINITY_DN62931_c0_g1_i1.p1 TRINITY_DN62931_c0_g1~~TRINITY_DN62931_c0_g1_i1.p1  ORF type:complete len:458 (-),score=69.27 TRINITY_DN62931_c0_g1_i1:31-1404(-)